MAICRFLGRSCIEIITLKDHIIIDPHYSKKPKKGIQKILLTHDHSDHADLDKIIEIRKNFSEPNLEIYGPKDLCKKLDLDIKGLKSGSSITLDNLTIEAFRVNCYKADNCLAYLIKKGQITLLHTADSAEFSKDLRGLTDRINYLFIACFKEFFNDYLDFVKDITPQITFPFHFNSGEEDSAIALAKFLNEKGYEAEFIEIGSEFEF